MLTLTHAEPRSVHDGRRRGRGAAQGVLRHLEPLMFWRRATFQWGALLLLLLRDERHTRRG